MWAGLSRVVDDAELQLTDAVGGGVRKFGSVLGGLEVFVNESCLKDSVIFCVFQDWAPGDGDVRTDSE